MGWKELCPSVLRAAPLAQCPKALSGWAAGRRWGLHRSLPAGCIRGPLEPCRERSPWALAVSWVPVVALGCWHDLWAVESSQVLLPSPATNPQTLLSYVPAASAEHCSFPVSVAVHKWCQNVFIFKQWHGAGWAGHDLQQEWGPESFA